MLRVGHVAWDVQTGLKCYAGFDEGFQRNIHLVLLMLMAMVRVLTSRNWRLSTYCSMSHIVNALVNANI